MGHQELFCFHFSFLLPRCCYFYPYLIFKDFFRSSLHRKFMLSRRLCNKAPSSEPSSDLKIFCPFSSRLWKMSVWVSISFWSSYKETQTKYMNFGICLSFVNKYFLIIKIHEITERLILWFLKVFAWTFQLVIFHCSTEIGKMLVQTSWNLKS